VQVGWQHTCCCWWHFPADAAPSAGYPFVVERLRLLSLLIGHVTCEEPESKDEAKKRGKWLTRKAKKKRQ